MFLSSWHQVVSFGDSSRLVRDVFVLSWLSSATTVEEGTRKEPNISWQYFLLLTIFSSSDNLFFFWQFFLSNISWQSFLLLFSSKHQLTIFLLHFHQNQTKFSSFNQFHLNLFPPCIFVNEKKNISDMIRVNIGESILLHWNGQNKQVLARNSDW